ncbi:MAG: hypothetical protein ACYDCW_05380 [Acidithiobacillus ferrivorans]
MSNENATNGTATKKTPSKPKRTARAPIRGAHYVETEGGQRKVAIEEFEARILASHKVDVTVLNPHVQSLGMMLMPADRALQNLSERASLTTNKEIRKKVRAAIASFEDAQADFMTAIYAIIEESGLEISSYLKRRIDRADGIEEKADEEKGVENARMASGFTVGNAEAAAPSGS